MKATRARYTLEFKLEAVRLVKAGQSIEPPRVSRRLVGLSRTVWA